MKRINVTLSQNNNTCKHRCSVTNPTTVCQPHWCVTLYSWALSTSNTSSKKLWALHLKDGGSQLSLFYLNVIWKPEEAQASKKKQKNVVFFILCYFFNLVVSFLKGTTMSVTVRSLLCLCYNCKAHKRFDSFGLLTWIFSHYAHIHSHKHLHTAQNLYTHVHRQTHNVVLKHLILHQTVKS